MERRAIWPDGATMTQAIYRAREDGDWDFVAAFNEAELPDAPSNWPEEICVWFASIGESCIVVDAPLGWLPGVLEGGSMLAIEAEMNAEATCGAFPATLGDVAAKGGESDVGEGKAAENGEGRENCEL